MWILLNVSNIIKLVLSVEKILRGIKADQSFHQHGPQQQAGNYGAAYLATMSFWAYILDDTSLALEQEHFKIISDYVNTGVRRILWKNKMDINNLGRQLYRQAQRHKGFSTLFSVNTLAGINSNNNNVYQALINENLGRTPGRIIKRQPGCSLLFST